MNPTKAIRKYCLECNGSANEVNLCPVEDCSLYDLRFGRLTKKNRSSLKAIRKRCINCSGHNTHESINCDRPDCVLHPYRKGTNPKREGIGGKGNPDIRFIAKKSKTHVLKSEMK